MRRIDDLKLQLEEAGVRRATMILLSKSARIRLDKANAEVCKVDREIEKINAALKKEMGKIHRNI